jgi:hypothetical protein
MGNKRLSIQKMENAIGLGIFSVASGSMAFDRCTSDNRISDIVAVVAWVILPFVAIAHVLLDVKSADVKIAILVANAFVIAFYSRFLRKKYECEI